MVCCALSDALLGSIPGVALELTGWLGLSNKKLLISQVENYPYPLPCQLFF
jgi:hypothetical protein